MSNKIIVNATVTPPTYFIKSSKQYTSLTQRRLSKEIPNFQDMEVLAQKRHLRKWLNKEAEIVCCATLGHIPKGCCILPQKHLFTHVHCCSIHNSQKLETT